MQPERRPNPDRSPESLEARLRALPQLRVPADLEARLLAAIPTEMPIPRRRAFRFGAVGALAAACLLAVLVWPRGDIENPVPGRGKDTSALQDSPRSPDDSASIAAWREARRVPDGAEMPTFTWPVRETLSIRISTSISPDLLD
jgi:ferric-dicitrate binding protein FerR (iron transport regulator)